MDDAEFESHDRAAAIGSPVPSLMGLSVDGCASPFADGGDFSGADISHVTPSTV